MNLGWVNKNFESCEKLLHKLKILFNDEFTNSIVNEILKKVSKQKTKSRRITKLVQNPTFPRELGLG